MSEKVLKIKDVAAYLQVNEKTVYSLAQQRRIPCFKVGGQWRFRREDLDAWIAEQTATRGDAKPSTGDGTSHRVASKGHSHG